jgi:hypothetical protein
LIVFLILAVIFVFVSYKYRHYFRTTQCNNLKSYEHYSLSLTDRLSQYGRLSARSGIVPISTNNEFINVIVKKKRLEKVCSNEYFTIASLSYSYPYLLSSAHSFLYEIAQNFNKRISGSHLNFVRIRVTSLLRTKEQQKKLQEVNENATASKYAPHTHGTSFDISYLNFSDANNNPISLSTCEREYLTNKLAETLFQLRKENKYIFVTKEENKKCFHIAVCR